MLWSVFKYLKRTGGMLEQNKNDRYFCISKKNQDNRKNN